MYRIMLISLLLLSGCVQDLEIRKDRGQATRELGEAYLAEGRYTMALKELLTAEKMYDQDPFLHNALGITYMAKARLPSAISHFEKAIEIKPDYTPSINNLGRAYAAIGDWDTAIKTFKSIIGNLLYSTPHYPLSNLGYAYYLKKDYTQSKYYYQEALKHAPKFTNALRGLGRVYLDVGKINDAVKMLEKAIDTAPQSAVIYLDLGTAYQRQQNRQKALNAYRLVLALSPDSPEAEKAKTAINNMH